MQVLSKFIYSKYTIKIWALAEILVLYIFALPIQKRNSTVGYFSKITEIFSMYCHKIITYKIHLRIYSVLGFYSFGSKVA